MNEQIINGVGDPYYTVDDQGRFTNKGSVPKPLTLSLTNLAMGDSNQYASKFYEYRTKQEDSILEAPHRITIQTPYKYFANLFESENQKALLKQMTSSVGEPVSLQKQKLPPIAPTSPSQTPTAQKPVTVDP